MSAFAARITSAVWDSGCFPASPPCQRLNVITRTDSAADAVAQHNQTKAPRQRHFLPRRPGLKPERSIAQCVVALPARQGHPGNDRDALHEKRLEGRKGLKRTRAFYFCVARTFHKRF